MTLNNTVVDRMMDLARQWEAQQDQRAIFLNCYALMTQNMHTALAEGRFQDPAWVATWLSRFADYYFDGLAAYERQDPATPAVWQLAHEATTRPQPHALQHLLLGVNAHINYDLTLTLAELLGSTWPTLTNNQRQRIQQDFDQVNVIIKETTNQVQDEVLEQHDWLMAWVDVLSGPLDEWLTGWLITGWRDEVWREAMNMMACADAAAQEQCRLNLEATSLARGRWILWSS